MKSPTLITVVSAIEENKPFASGYLDEYLTTLSDNIEGIRIATGDSEFDEKVVESIDEFISSRNEIISLFVALAQYMPTEENIIKVHRFFESLIPYMSQPKDSIGWTNFSADNFKFIIHELFLYAVAILIKHERFFEVDLLLTRLYYVGGQSDYNNEMVVGYDVFQNSIGSLHNRNKQLNPRQLSLHACLLKNRSENSEIYFWYLVQADFVLCIRDQIQYAGDYIRWSPETLVYLEHRTFEVFAKSSSKAHFDKVKCILGIDKSESREKLQEYYDTGKLRSPLPGNDTINTLTLLGYENLATKR